MKTPFTLTTLFRSPIFWLGVAMCLLGLVILRFNGPNWKKSIINSDGRGYYYFLPALSTADKTYQSTLESEKQIVGSSAPQLYILKTEEGKYTNKCYPGVAILQSPFYLLATGIDYLSGAGFNGYSDTHLLAFFWASMLYVFLSMVFFQKSMKLFFGSAKYTWLLSILLVFGTNVWYQAVFYCGLSHHYSLFLFSIFCWNVLRYKRDSHLKYLVYLGIILGLLFLVRPTNIMVLAFLPFLFGSRESFVEIWKLLFRFKNAHLISFVVSCGVVLAILPLITYWQTGHFFYWSYQGEGFDFSGKHLIETWFSYRVGIFVLTPITLFALAGLVYWLRKDRYLLITWLLPFVAITYVLSSWWCWDYQSFFGHRGFTEFQFLFLFPLLVSLQVIKSSGLKYSLLGLIMLYMGIRSYQKLTGIYNQQRFTAYTYWKSMFDFNSSVRDKYYVFANCQPYGRVVSSKELVPEKLRYEEFDENKEFGSGTDYFFTDKSKHIRYFCEVHINKQLLDEGDWRDVNVTFVGESVTGEIVHYSSFPMYHFYKEGRKEWSVFDIQEEYYPFFDSSHKMIVYIWNKGKKRFKVDDFRILLKKIDSRK